jgi:hypothetical protein
VLIRLVYLFMVWVFGLWVPVSGTHRVIAGIGCPE